MTHFALVVILTLNLLLLTIVPIIVGPLTMACLQIPIIVSWNYNDKFSKICHSKCTYYVNVVKSCHGKLNLL